MESELSKPISIFRRKRTGCVTGLILGSVPGLIFAPLIGLLRGHNVVGDSIVYILPVCGVVGLCGGSMVGSLGGFLGALIAEKLDRGNLVVFIFGIIGSIILLAFTFYILGLIVD